VDWMGGFGGGRNVGDAVSVTRCRQTLFVVEKGEVGI